jgi:hypothetical protein
MRSIKKQSIVLLMLGAIAAVSNAAKFSDSHSKSGMLKDSRQHKGNLLSEAGTRIL